MAKRKRKKIPRCPVCKQPRLSKPDGLCYRCERLIKSEIEFNQAMEPIIKALSRAF